jgi:4'-phosphopantetheinyl transferase EntD
LNLGGVAVEVLLRAGVARHVTGVTLGPGDDPEPLHPVEAEAVARAVPDRVREFALGRTAARRALWGWAGAATPIPAGPDRGPVWPEGMVGSISHAGGHAVAVVGRRADGLAGLGIDIEHDGAVGPEELAVLATAAERARLDAAPDPASRATYATVLHGAKECVHKVVQPATGVALEPTDADVDVAAAGTWTATLLRSAGPIPAGTRLRGGWAVCALDPAPAPPFVVTGLALADRWTGAPDSANISIQR